MFKNLWSKLVSIFTPEPPAPTPAPKVKACGCTTGECPKCLTTPSSPIVQQKLEKADETAKKHEQKIPATLKEVIAQETPKDEPQPEKVSYHVAEGEKPKPRTRKPAKKEVALIATPAPCEPPKPAPKKRTKKKPDDKGVCELPTDKAKDGSNCGDRASSVKPGGK